MIAKCNVTECNFVKLDVDYLGAILHLCLPAMKAPGCAVPPVCIRFAGSGLVAHLDDRVKPALAYSKLFIKLNALRLGGRSGLSATPAPPTISQALYLTLGGRTMSRGDQSMACGR